MVVRSEQNLEQTVTELLSRLGATERALEQVRETVKRQAQETAAPAAGPLVNLLPDSDCNFSVDDWDSGPPPAGGDIAYELKYWYRFPDTDTLLAEDAAHALKAVGHSLYAANEGANPDIPVWDKTNGHIRMGAVGATNWMIGTPFVVNHARPGGELQFQVIVELLSSLGLPADVGLAAWIHDNTAGQQKTLEGGDLTLNTTVVGTPGTTSTEYFLVATTDFGQQYKSNLSVVATAPDILNAPNYVALSWNGVPGTNSYDIYRNRGGVIKLVYQVRNGQTSYWDQGAEVSTVAAYPAVTDTKAKAYTVIPAARFLPLSTGWQTYGASIVVPATYAQANTTGRQWLLVKPTNPTAESRQLKMDHFGLGEQYGLWSKSFYDERVKNNVSTAMTGSDQGTVGSGGSGGADYGTGDRIDREFNYA